MKTSKWLLAFAKAIRDPDFRAAIVLLASAHSETVPGMSAAEAKTLLERATVSFAKRGD